MSAITATPSKSASAATASMVLGIVGTVYGVLFGWLFSLPALVLGVVGLVQYSKAEKNGKATTGLVLGIINTVLAGIWFLFWVFVIAVGSGS